MNVGFSGEFLLTAVFLLCGFSAAFGLVAANLPAEKAQKIYRSACRSMYTAAALLVLTFVLLTIAFLTDDFSIAAVSQYSSKALPLSYKVSAVWAGSAGSLLLWTVGLFLLFGLSLTGSNKADVKLKAVTLAVGGSVCLGFSALLVFAVKPFAPCPVTLDDGRGLNPLLQNFWMIVHPPLLFVGYSAFLVPFVVTLASVFAGAADDVHLYRRLRRWLLFGVCFLSLGIATGAKWSYVELGWGGYWAWDPVENASLLPWLVAVAAIHSLIGLKLAQRFRLCTIALGPMPFLLCLLATFITRSGVLTSVHAFDAGAMFSALLVFIVFCFLLWLASVIVAAKRISSPPPTNSLSVLSKPGLLFSAAAVLVLTALVIAVATFWPVFSRAVTGAHTTVALTRLFYDRVVSAVAVVLAFLVGAAALFDLRKRTAFIIRLLSCCIAGLLCFALVLSLTKSTTLIALACAAAAFSFVAVSLKLWISLSKARKFGPVVAHLGFLLLVVAAGLSSLEQSIQPQLAKAEKASLGKYLIQYDTFRHSSFGEVTGVGPEVVLTKQPLTKRLWPHNNLYPDGRTTAEVAVHTRLWQDIYLTFDGITRDGRVLITARLKPAMLWLWIAAVLIVAGFALACREAGKNRK